MERWELAPVAGAILISLVAAGCVTKKYVRQKIDSVNESVSRVEQESNQKIQSLDERISQGLSRLDERATSADAHAREAAQIAEQANQQVLKAALQAREAHTIAAKALSRNEQLARAIENVDNYRPVSTEKVLFDFGRATLTRDARTALDQLAETLTMTGHYLLEVKGYTDSIGSTEYNLELSRRRADAVVNYLTQKRRISLYRIHVAGFGKTVSASQRTSRKDRRQDRRVDLTVFSIQKSTGGQ